MHRLGLALPLLLACARPTVTSVTSGPAQTAYAAREGDTVLVLMHQVRATNRADYERFMTDVWYPRAKKFAAKTPNFGAALARRWRLVGTEPDEGDSLYTYMFLYPAYQAVGSPSEMWRQIGLPEEQIARDSARQSELIETAGGFAAVRREYSPTDSGSPVSSETVPAPTDRHADEQAIRGLETTWRAALMAKDTAAIRRFYAESGYYLPQGSTGFTGSAAIADRWAGEISGGEFRLEREAKTIEVAEAGDMAYEVGTYTVAWNKPGEGRSGGGTGNYVTVWQKVGGEWKTTAYIWNQDARR